MGQLTHPKQKRTKTTIFKVFIDVHREIEWLNAMSKKGYHLVARRMFFYDFVVDSSKCYQYQVDLRALRGGESEHRTYSEFLSEMGIEIACKYINYVYLKREALEPFEFFTDSSDWRKQYFRHAITNGAVMVLLILYLISMSNRNWPGASLIEVEGVFRLTFGALITSALAMISGLGLKHYLRLWSKEGVMDQGTQ